MIVNVHNSEPAGHRGSASVSILDVARVAGVSYQTVSRVINDHPNVSAATRHKVQQAIDELGFRRSRAARALASGRADTVTVLTSNTGLYGYSETLRGVEEAARVAGMQVAISVIESGRGADIEAAVEAVSDPRTGAVLVLAFDQPGARALRAIPPTVRSAAAAESYLGRHASESERARWASFDDVKAAREATEHLLGLGHRTVHHLTIPSSTKVGDRQRGWQDALKRAGIVAPDVLRPSDWAISAAYDVALPAVRDEAVTAVLCGNDDQALAVIRAAHDVGRRVPDDLSVVGFDDVPWAGYLTPALTTVRFDFAALGRRTLQLLLQDHPQPLDAEELPLPHLVIRASTAPPP